MPHDLMWFWLRPYQMGSFRKFHWIKSLLFPSVGQVEMGAPPPPNLPKLPIFYIIQTLAFYYFVFGRFSTFITRFVTSGFLVKPTIDHWWRIFMLMKGQIKIGYTYSSSSFLAAKTTYEKWKRAKKKLKYPLAGEFPISLCGGLQPRGEAICTPTSWPDRIQDPSI